MADLHQLHSEAEDMQVKLAALMDRISQHQKDLQTENDGLKKDLLAASEKAQRAEESLAVCLERAKNFEIQARERDRGAVTREQELKAQVADLQQKVLEEGTLRRASEDKLNEALSELKAVRRISTQAGERHAETVRSPPPTTASKSEHWRRRITEIVGAHPEGIHLNDIEWKWMQLYPNEDPQNSYRPVKKLKDAVQYVTGVEVDSDLIVRLTRERSRSPRASPAQESTSTSPTTDLSAHEAFLAVAAQFVSGTVEASAGQASSSSNQDRQSGIFNQGQLELIGGYARSWIQPNVRKHWKNGARRSQTVT